MRFLFFGDIVSKVGRKGIAKVLPNLKDLYKPDLIIANAENTTHGNGISFEHYEFLLNYGFDLLTSGNHIWKRKQSLEILNLEDSKLIRPANYPQQNPGQGFKTFSIGKNNIIVLNLQGRVFMNENIDCPFKYIDEFLNKLDNKDEYIIILDFHAEATSEKVALANYVDGRVNVILGTHTHIQTADIRILPKGSLYITDVGGCYALDSVIGVEKFSVIESFKTQLPLSFDYPEFDKCIINAVFFEIEDNKVLQFERIYKIIDI